MPDTVPLDAVRRVMTHVRAELLGHPDVHGIGVGHRRRGGAKTDEFAIVVHVLRKLSTADVPPSRLLPETFSLETGDGGRLTVGVDVQEHPKPVSESDRVRPTPGGVSAGASGTLGGWVWDMVTRQVVALSNAHVFGTDAGRLITQPSLENGGREDEDVIATVIRSGSLDAAVAVPIAPDVVSRSIACGGEAVLATGAATVGMRVQKTGSGTGLTFGTVDLIDYDSDYFGSRSDLWIDGGDSDFSSGGDSGSLYLEVAADTASPLRIVGLHWGGSGHDGVGHRIQDVFADLSLTTLPSAARPLS